MAGRSVWILPAGGVAISDGAVLDGMTQGDGSHLVGRDITLQSESWERLRLLDDDATFDDNDSGQRLDGAQVIGGIAYDSGRVVEAEYQLELEAPDGSRFTVIGVNLREPNSIAGNSFGTIEGLAFVGDLPPPGVPLRVISAREGPNFQGTPAVAYDDLAAPICFTPGTRIRVPGGWAAVEGLVPGDRVVTRDRGAQRLVWVGRRRLSAARLAADPALAPLLVRAHAFGPGRPGRDLMLSPQHRGKRGITPSRFCA